MEYISFSWTDYAIFIFMFGVSCAIGAYYGWFAKQNHTISEYLLGERKMRIFPISMSLVASTLSGITLLSMPAEVYVHGTQYMLVLATSLVLYLVLNYIYLPVFWKLKLTTVFEYLEIRFDKRLRTMASLLFTLSTLFYLPLVIYAPSLAFNQMTGFNLYIIAVIMSSICIFYTALGGLKAVVWTDTLQFCLTLCTLLFVSVMGILSVGGISEIWEKASYGERLELFNMDPDPTIRNTFWTIFVGINIMWISYAITNPGISQRFLAVPTLRDSRKVLQVFVLFKIITNGLCCFSGLIIYAKYYSCDPLSSRQIKKADQILPFYVMDVAKQFPGLSGLFVAGLFSTALSTLSTSLNALSGIIYQDFVSQLMPSSTSERTASSCMKTIAVLLGLLSVGMVFIINKLGTVIELASSLSGSTAGPLLGIFTLGVLFPIANKKGAFFGTVFSLVIMSAATVYYQMQVWNGYIKYKPKPLYVYGCNESYSLFINETYSFTDAVENNYKSQHWFVKISVHYYVAIGTMITIIIGLVVSYFTKNSNTIVNPDALCPCMRRFVPFSRQLVVEKELDTFNTSANVNAVESLKHS